MKDTIIKELLTDYKTKFVTNGDAEPFVQWFEKAITTAYNSRQSEIDELAAFLETNSKDAYHSGFVAGREEWRKINI